MFLNCLKLWTVALWQTDTARWWVDQSRIAPSWHLGPLYWRQNFTADLSYLAAVLWVNRVLLCTPLLLSGCLQFYLLSFTLFFKVFFDCILFNTILVRIVCLLLLILIVPTLLFVWSIHDLIQFTNVGENYQWRVSRILSLFQQQWARNQFSLLRELLSEPSGMMFTVRSTAEFYLTWRPLEQSLDFSVTQPWCRFCASLMLSIHNMCFEQITVVCVCHP